MISVVMGVSRFDNYVKKAIDSIFAQTMSEFELIIIANGEHSDDIDNSIQKLYFNEPRLRILKSCIGQLAYALNLGIDNAKYEYIARMDSDDIAMPERLEKQLSFLLRNNLDMVGSDVWLIDEHDQVCGKRVTKKGKSINDGLPYGSTFVHPSVLIKKSVLINVRGYNSGFNSEDYDLWLRLKRLGIAWDNMDEQLLSYRVHGASSQRRLLGYAECAGYALREFILKRSLVNLGAIFLHLVKSVIRPTRH